MRHWLLLIALGSLACNRTPEERSPGPKPAETVETATAPDRQSTAPLVLPMPKDQQELDRLILAGYTPHGDHLHPPGVKNCPLAKEGNEAVM
jgi:hypothetical protein